MYVCIWEDILDEEQSELRESQFSFPPKFLSKSALDLFSEGNIHVTQEENSLIIWAHLCLWNFGFHPLVVLTESTIN